MGFTVAELERELMVDRLHNTNMRLEVEEARGSLGSLTDRLDVSLNQDGTLRPSELNIGFVRDESSIVASAIDGAWLILDGDRSSVYVVDRRVRFNDNDTLTGFVQSAVYDAETGETTITFQEAAGVVITAIGFSFNPNTVSKIHHSELADILPAIEGADDTKNKHVSNLQLLNKIPYAQGIRRVADINALRLLTPDLCTVVFIECHTTPGDGGHGTFYWDASSTAADDNGVTIAVTGVATGRWVRQLNGFVTPEMFGGVANGITDCTSSSQAAYSIAESLKLPLIYTSGEYLHSGDGDTLTIIEESTIIVLPGATIIKDGTNAFIRVAGSDDEKIDNVVLDIQGIITVPSVGTAPFNAGVQIGAGTGREYGTIRIPNLTTIGMGQYGLVTGSGEMFVDKLLLGDIYCLANGTTTANVLSDPIVLKPGTGVDTSLGHIKYLSANNLVCEQLYNFAVAPVGTAATKIQYVLDGVINNLRAEGGTEATCVLDHCNVSVGVLDVHAVDADGLQISGQTTTSLLIDTLVVDGPSTNVSSLTLGSTGSNGVVINNAKLAKGITSANNAAHTNFHILQLSAGGSIALNATLSSFDNGSIRNAEITGVVNVTGSANVFENIKTVHDSAVNGFRVTGDTNLLTNVNVKGTKSGAYPIYIAGDDNVIKDSYQEPNGASRAYRIASGTGNILRNCRSSQSANLSDAGTGTQYIDSQGFDMLSDAGNAPLTIVNGVTPQTIRYLTPITANRQVTIPTLSATVGMTYKIVRSADCTGAFTVNIVGASALKSLGVGEWAVVEYATTGWFISAYGTL